MGRKRERWSCNINGCENIHAAKGYCHNHYYKYREEKKCNSKGCDNGQHAKGYCCTHYTRLRKNGDLKVRQRWGKNYTSLEDYLNKNHKKESSGCWIWTGNFGRRNYGVVGNFSLAKKLKIYQAHRLSFIVHKGEIPDGIFVCHTCDNPPCINPDHLFLGTHEDNMKDMDSKGRRVVHQGEKSIKAKLTKEQAIYILQNMETITALELSTKFNVSRQTIQNVWRGITKYIEPEIRDKILMSCTENQEKSTGSEDVSMARTQNPNGDCMGVCEHQSDGCWYYRSGQFICGTGDFVSVPNDARMKCKKCREFYR